jgi:hypothetical protein
MVVPALGPGFPAAVAGARRTGGGRTGRLPARAVLPHQTFADDVMSWAGAMLYDRGVRRSLVVYLDHLCPRSAVDAQRSHVDWLTSRRPVVAAYVEARSRRGYRRTASAASWRGIPPGRRRGIYT